MYFFTADEHYNHANIIKYCNRPFDTVEEMNEALIANHNECVLPGDVVVHAGDFFLRSRGNKMRAEDVIKRLDGHHIFLHGSHDHWLKGKEASDIWQKKIPTIADAPCSTKKHVVVCHYQMAVWPQSHRNSWHLFGHSHGRRTPMGKSLDIGVDNCGFMPISWTTIIRYMEQRPSNPNCLPEYLGV